MKRTMTKDIVLTTVSESSDTTLQLAKMSGVVLGFVEKTLDTPTEQHPWKVFDAIVGQGPVRVKLGSMKAFYSASLAMACLRGKV